MKMLSKSEWKPFKVHEIFITQRYKGKLQMPTGASISKKDLVEKGKTPRITVTGFNNGIYGFYDYCGEKASDYRVFNNFISVSFLGTVFYQKGNASLDMKVHCLKPINATLNEYSGEFLVGAIKASLRKSSYADQISSSLLPYLTIMLPVTDKGNPDFIAMENYIKSREITLKAKLDALEKIEQEGYSHIINISKWKYFHLYDENLFVIDSGTKLDKVKMTNFNPSVNFVGRANANNGVTDYIDMIPGLKPYDAGLLTISLGGEYLGSCFVQDKPFYTSQNVNVLIPRHKMSFYSKMFISTVIFREGRLHYKAFIDELNRHMKRDFAIPLPSLPSGSPDFEYMDCFIRDRMNSVTSFLSRLEEIE